MSDRDLLELIARRLEDEEDLVQRCRDAFERCEQASRINKETRERNIDALDTAMETMNRLDGTLEERIAISNEFVRDMVRRVEVAGQRSDAWFELLLGRTEALTEAMWRLLDRFDEGPATT